MNRRSRSKTFNGQFGSCAMWQQSMNSFHSGGNSKNQNKRQTGSIFVQVGYKGKAKYLIGVILDPVLAVFHDFYIFKNGKNSIFAPEKSLKPPKILFFSVRKLQFW